MLHVHNKFKAKYFNHKFINKLPFTFKSEREREERVKHIKQNEIGY